MKNYISEIYLGLLLVAVMLSVFMVGHKLGERSVEPSIPYLATQQKVFIQNGKMYKIGNDVVIYDQVGKTLQEYIEQGKSIEIKQVGLVLNLEEN